MQGGKDKHMHSWTLQSGGTFTCSEDFLGWGAGFEIDSSYTGCCEVCKDALVRRTGGLSDQGHRLSPLLQLSASWPVSWGSEHKGEVSRLNASESSKLFS